MNNKRNQLEIQGHSVEIIEYKGNRVITLSTIDSLHKRPKGTAGRNFRENREKLISGEDYIELNQSDEIRRLGFKRPQGGFSSKVFLFTQSGYLMLVKSFTDDLAWKVQRELVNSYFTVKEIKKYTKNKNTGIEIRRAILLYKKEKSFLMSEGKLDENQAKLRANIKVKEEMDIDLFKKMDLILIAPKNERLYTPTELAKILNVSSGQAVNKMLEAKGLQIKERDHKGRVVWEATDLGKSYSRSIDESKKNADGSIQCLRWYKPVTIFFKGSIAAND